MAGSITLAHDGLLSRVTLANPGKHNAIDVAMWRELRAAFEQLQGLPAAQAPLAVIVCGEGGHFASGGDIAEFAGFRFDEARLHDFHEHIVAPALLAMLACDIPLLAQIEGACIGGGLEIAACCDIRIAAAGSRFGVPIAKLGFPMAPAEMQIVAAVIGSATLRELLLEARVLDAATARERGLVNHVVADESIAAEARHLAERIALLSPQALRLNKRALRAFATPPLSRADERVPHYAYADSAEHREGLAAFNDKRSPRF
jgi:enoyl-CoA hydratase